MNVNPASTPGSAPRGARLVLFVSLFAAFALSALLLAGYAAPLARHFGAGRRAEALHVTHARLTPLDFFRHAPNGRALLDRSLLRPGIHLRPNAQTGVVVPISSPVQTYDVFNPPPAFRPLIGFGTAAALNDNSANPPVYVSSLLPTNRTPVWSSDETFLVFSSNRNLLGGLNADGTNPDGTTGPRFHLWAILISGGEAFQITASTGPVGGGEMFPALLPNNTAIAYTSDANSPGVQNLYEITNFSFPALAGGAAPVVVNSTQAAPNPSLTIRGNDGNGQPLTGFDQVQRPTFSPTNPGEIVFSAHSVTGTNAGHYHLYFLYAQTLGFDPNTNFSYPGKLTDGPADDTDPTISPDGGFIAFSSTAGSFANQPNGMNSFGPNPPSSPQDPNQSQSISSAPGAARGIFLLGGGSSANGVGFGTVPPSLSAANNQGGTLGGGRVTQPGTDDFGPAWSSFSNKNQYTNPTGDFGYLAFGRASAGQPHDIYYLQVLRGVTSPNTQSILSETAAGAATPNNAVKLNTDDNAGETTTAGNAFDDVYPAWSPFLSVFRLVYGSDRTVTYNNPATSVPVEVAASVPQNGSVAGPDAASGYTVGATYSGLLLSQLVNLDPPTLLRFSANEVVHVQASGPDPVNGTPNKLAATGGQPITLTVRLSNREAGIDDTGGPNGGPRVYVQIKDPSSKYQNSQNTEHKVFAKDFLYDGPLQTNRPQSDVTSGSANTLVDNFTGFDSSYTPQMKYGYPSYGPFVGPIPVRYLPRLGTNGTGQTVFLPLRGAHGGEYAAGSNNPDLEDLYIGKAAAGTTNPFTAPGGSSTSGGVTTPSTITFPIGNPYQIQQTTDPNQFIPQGPEYECQVVNPQFSAGGNTDTTLEPATDTAANPAATVGDYVTPYWLAGINDQNPFSGGAYASSIGALGLTRPNGIQQTDRPTADYAATNSQNTNTTHPAEWLQLTRVPAAQQDNKGGVLYTVTWTTPTSGSDFFTDIIAYDKAVFPNLPANTSAFSGRRTNWRIYDNVGGFSTNQSVGNNDILVVSDYALGQKFAATTFGGQNSNGNLVPKLFGTESYLTDIDVNRLPDSVFAGQPAQQLGANPQYITYDFYPVVQTFPTGTFGDPNAPFGYSQNGLGVNSYNDGVTDDGVQQDMRPNVQSQRYSIWRILSRGPVPTTVLNSYLPTKVTQPAIADPGDPNYKNIPAKTVLDAPRCVVWLSPYTGDVLTDPGALDDPGTINVAGQAPRQSTTQILHSFAQAGGRLFLTGQNAGSALTIGGTSANGPGGFLSDVLNATLAAPTGGTNILAATNNRITGGSNYNNQSLGQYVTQTENPVGSYNYIVVSPNFPYQDNLVLSDIDYSDSALSQIPAETLPGGGSVQGQINVITPTNGAVTAITYGAGGPAALVYHDDPYDSTKPGTLPNGGTGSRVVYAAFGMEALSNDYFTVEAPNPATSSSIGPPPSLQIPQILPRNPRPAILHNIVSFLRTGRVSGTITQTAGTGQGAGLGIQGVTVYLKPIGGVPPSTRVAFSATTGSGGAFTIVGVEPGTYTLVAIKPGFARAASNSNVSFTVEGDTTATNATLTLTPANPGSIAGVVKDTGGNPINNATVTFTSQDGSVTQTATTANGSVTTNPKDNYFVQNVPITNYTGTAVGPNNPNGRPEYTAAAAPDAPNAAGITVQGNQTTDGVNFTLTPILVGIKGHLFDLTAGADAAANVVPGTTHITLVNQASITAANPKGTIVEQEDNLPGSNFDFENVPAAQTPTTYVITATNPNYATSTRTVTVYLGDVLTNQDIGLNPLPRVNGIVTDSSTGKGIARATVTFTPVPGSPAGAKVVVVKTADGTDPTKPIGTYTAGATDGIVAATYSVTAAVGGYTPSPSSPQPATVTLQPGAPVTQNFVLTPIPPGTLTGKVTDQTGAGVPNATVTFVSSDGSQTITATTGPDGSYTKTGVVPTTYTGTAIGPNNPNGRPTTTVSATHTATVGAGQTVTVPFTVAEIAPSLAGRIYNAAGAGGDVAANALPRATVTVTNKATGAVVYSVQTPDGNYSTGPLPLAPAGTTYVVTAALTGYGANSLTVTVYNGDTLTGQDVGLMPLAPGTISGFVKDNLGGPLAGITVTFTASDGTQTVSAVTGADGSYTVSPVPPATGSLSYTGTASVPTNPNGKPEYQTPAPQTVMVSASTGATANFTEVQILPTVTGVVTDAANGSPLVGATVTFTPTTGTATPVVVTTGAGGAYSVTSAQNLQPGTYTVTASQPGYFTGSVTLTVFLGDTLTQPFALTEKGTLFGLVKDAGTQAALAGVLITVADSTGATVATIPASVSTGAVTQGPDNLPINYSASLPPGTYTVTAAKGSYNSKSQTVVLSQGPGARADFTLVSSIGTLGGLVTNATDTTPVGAATITVTDAGKNTVATFTTSGATTSPAAPNGDGSPLNYSGQLAQGTYTVTLTFAGRPSVSQPVTIVGGQFTRLDFTGANGIAALHTFPAGLNFVSTPYDYSNLGFDGLFGALNTTATGTQSNGNRSHVAVWNPLLGQYAIDPAAPADTLRLGVGYWVFLKNPAPVTRQGATPTAANVPVSLHAFWNQIGVPNPKGVAISSLLFDNGSGGTITFAQATGGQYHLASPTLYSYNGQSYVPLGPGDILQPWQAYWIKVYSDATLEMPTQ